MAGFEPIINDEMMGQLAAEVYEYVKKGTLSKLKVIGVARELIEKRDDKGQLIFYDVRVEGKDKPIGLDTMISRIRIIIQNWKKYLGPFMETLLIEAAYKHATKAKDSPASFKIAASVIMPPESDSGESKPALPPGVAAILQNNPVGTTIIIGKDNGTRGLGEAGHERADTVHPVATEQGQDIAPEVVPRGHDKPVHGVHEGGNTTERYTVPDTAMAPEDTNSDDSGGDMGTSQ